MEIVDRVGAITALRGGSLQPLPARSYTQTRVVAATAGAIQAAMMVEGSPSPASSTTVGLSVPVQSMWSR